MEKKSYLEIASDIASEAHAGQNRWDNKPYIIHPKRVAESMETDTQKATAWLHDVVEDTTITLKDLEKLGIPGPVISAVKAITKRDDEEYVGYIARVAKDKIARKVKIADLYDNLNDIIPCTKQRAEKYALSMWILQNIENGKWEI